MDDEGLTMKKPRYITWYGYFGRTSNVKDAPAVLDSAMVGRILGALPPAGEKRK
ncbi:hypothetical protein SAMN02927924_01670 [Sphingobium faniae]|nr:hypothetical protein SAMN02927924_01670 [Sphingobium faniae]